MSFYFRPLTPTSPGPPPPLSIYTLRMIKLRPNIPQEIGCDLELRTNVRLDKCGVCGGDGSTCHGHRYVWEQGELMVCHILRDSGTVFMSCHARKVNWNVNKDSAYLYWMQLTTYVTQMKVVDKILTYIKKQLCQRVHVLP